MSVLAHDPAYEDFLLARGRDMTPAERRDESLAERRDEERWYVALWGPGDGKEKARVMQAEPRGRSELNRTLDLFLLRCVEDMRFYVVIRRDRETTADGLVTVRVPEELGDDGDATH